MTIQTDHTNDTLTPTGGTLTVTGGVSTSTNLAFTGTGNRITGDFSNATLANRVMFQTTAANTTTAVAAIPSGTGISATWDAYSTTDTANASFSRVQIVGGLDLRIVSGITGTGTYLPIAMYTGGSERLRIFTSGGVSIGNTTDKGAASLNVSGLIFPQQAATASAPAYQKGAIYFDTTLNKLRVGGATAWETITSV
jgi:hypothetical protein